MPFGLYDWNVLYQDLRNAPPSLECECGTAVNSTLKSPNSTLTISPHTNILTLRPTTYASDYVCSLENSSVQFTLSNLAHSAWQPSANCALPLCITYSNNNNNSSTCRTSLTPCYDYRTATNMSYCAPGSLCSMLEQCDNVTGGCASNSYVCVVNSCCTPYNVCLPLSWTSLCSSVNDTTSTVVSSTTTASTTSSTTPAPAVLGWITTGSLNHERFVHAASTLTNGSVLVTGGRDQSGLFVSDAEFYDLSTQVWTLTGRINVGRASHTSTLLANGKVLIAGGFDFSGALNSAELYDPSPGTWTFTNSLNVGRLGHTASILANGQVLVSGGYNGTSVFNTAELYDPSSGTWTLTNNLNVGRWGHTASILANGKVLVSGGYNGSSAITNAEVYDPSMGSWTTTGSLYVRRWGHTSSLLTNGKVLVAAGYDNVAGINDAELY
ncbi:unnamed protein product [Rotaria socialis]|uniref:Uncharacterized protein n=2 Tax=Rotaria socialis TaxID=392032 RepID=A0A818GC71_9BILA|nr:unnamed protein product [Rotaria socialis]